jgi:NAD dependent epimerase/dehydratase family enzyme
MSWITLDDLCLAVLHCILAAGLHGPVNTVAPTPVTNLEFTRTLGRVLARPTLLPLPAFAARIALGEMADELLLASTRVEPAKLLSSRFGFRHRELEPALRDLLT